MKIFIISGKARAGKDTTALYIKEYYEQLGKKVINLQNSYYIKMYAKEISGWDGNEKTKPRELLQTLGTDIIRKEIDEYFFINRICQDIEVYKRYFDIITISDARFPYEIDIPKQKFKDVISINIIRPDYQNNLTEKQSHHKTETSLDEYHNYDEEIINNKTLEDLKTKVIKILQKY